MYVYAQLPGHGYLYSRFAWDWQATAAFVGSGHMWTRFAWPWSAVASFVGRGHVRSTPSLPVRREDFRNLPASAVNLTTYSDADYAMTFQWTIDDEPFDFTDHQLMMMVRHLPEDHEVFLSLESSTDGIPADESGIDLRRTIEPGPYDKFDIIIARDDLEKIPPGTYVHSLILVRPDGLREDIWRGTLTHAIGPTRD